MVRMAFFVLECKLRPDDLSNGGISWNLTMFERI